jgi:hypothetical protein
MSVGGLASFTGPSTPPRQACCTNLLQMVEQQNSAPESEFQIKCIFVPSDELSGWARGRRLGVNRATFFSFISSKIFSETMNEADLTDRLYTQHSPMSGHGCERSGRLCLLIDEMQTLMEFEDADMQRGSKTFLDLF